MRSVSGVVFEYLKEPVSAEIAAKSAEWVLLGQFGTLSDSLMFGDCGAIYYCIRRADLEARRFDRIHLTLQCG